MRPGEGLSSGGSGPGSLIADRSFPSGGVAAREAAFLSAESTSEVSIAMGTGLVSRKTAWRRSARMRACSEMSAVMT
jgi:hypothetical protein